MKKMFLAGLVLAALIPTGSALAANANGNKIQCFRYRRWRVQR